MRETIVTISGAVAVALYGWWASSLEHFTWQSRLAILIPGLLLLAVAGRRTPHRRRPRTEHAERVGAATWGTLGLLVVAWELFNFFHGHRTQYPTLSSLVNDVDSTSHAIRFLMFLGWLALGWDLGKLA